GKNSPLLLASNSKEISSCPESESSAFVSFTFILALGMPTCFSRASKSVTKGAICFSLLWLRVVASFCTFLTVFHSFLLLLLFHYLNALPDLISLLWKLAG